MPTPRIAPRVILSGTRFSPTDCDVILDRLAMPDAIAEALTDSDTPPDYSADDVLEAAATLERVFRGELVLLRKLTPVEADTLADAIEGSTWAAPTWGRHGRAALGAKTFDRILGELARAGAKVAELLGRRLHIPEC